MNQRSLRTIDTIPVGPLGVIPLASCAEIGKKVDNYLVTWRKENTSEHKSNITFSGYEGKQKRSSTNLFVDRMFTLS